MRPRCGRFSVTEAQVAAVKTRTLRDASVVSLIAIGSIATLTPSIRAMLLAGSLDSLASILPYTAWPALRVWTFWTVGTVVLGAALLRIEPKLGALDAALGGAVGLWVFAWIGGNALGPIGLFRSWTIWAMLAAVALSIWRAGFPTVAAHLPSPGLRLTLLAVGIAALGVIPMQLGSPVPPYMDVLATPASAQRIVTFGQYLPFDNDPYGYWSPLAQCPGLELLYALLALGSSTDPAVLAMSAAMFPMTLLLVVATYRLGRTLGGDMTGGLAALLLFATILMRVLPQTMHGRAVTFALAGVGLAFFLDERRNRTRVVVGVLALGTAVASHVIIGTLAMMVASAAVVCWLLDGDVSGFVAGLGLLAGATLIALPSVVIGLSLACPYPSLPLVQCLGALVIGASVRRLPGTILARTFSRWLAWGTTLALLVVLAWRPRALSVLQDRPDRFPILFVSGSLGLAIMLVLDMRRRATAVLSTASLFLLLGVAIEWACVSWLPAFADTPVGFALADILYKLDYWYPYAFLFPAAYLFAWLSRSWSPGATMLAVLLLLFIPWRDNTQGNFISHQMAVGEWWAQSIGTAKGGYWWRTGDPRWAQTPAELELVEVLRREIAEGRITVATHILHLTPHTLMARDVVLFSVFTGINDDPYVADKTYRLDVGGTAGSRLRRAEPAAVQEALAKRPPYIVIHEDPVPLPAEAVGDYEELFHRDDVRLLRRWTLTDETRL